MHVREPDGKPSRKLDYYKEVADRVRSSDTDVVINFTTGMGGDFEVGEGKDPLNPVGSNTDMIHALDRLEHIEELLPEICTLDCGSLNFGDTNMLFVHTPIQLRAAAKKMQELGVKPEMEAFEMGHLWFANQLVKEGLIEDPPWYQISLGIPWGAPADTNAMKSMVDMIPPNGMWAGSIKFSTMKSKEYGNSLVRICVTFFNSGKIISGLVLKFAPSIGNSPQRISPVSIILIDSTFFPISLSDD